MKNLLFFLKKTFQIVLTYYNFFDHFNLSSRANHFAYAIYGFDQTSKFYSGF